MYIEYGDGSKKSVAKQTLSSNSDTSAGSLPEVDIEYLIPDKCREIDIRKISPVECFEQIDEMVREDVVALLIDARHSSRLQVMEWLNGFNEVALERVGSIELTMGLQMVFFVPDQQTLDAMITQFNDPEWDCLILADKNQELQSFYQAAVRDDLTKLLGQDPNEGLRNA